MDEEQKLRLIRKFLGTSPAISLRQFVERVKADASDDHERNLAQKSFNRWAQEASEEIGGEIRLPGLEAQERKLLVELRKGNNRKQPAGRDHEVKIALIRDFMATGLSIRQFIATKNPVDSNGKPVGHSIFGRWVKQASEEVGGKVGLPGLEAQERKLLAERREEKNLHTRSGRLGSSAMASAAAAGPDPARLTASDSYGTTPLPPFGSDSHSRSHGAFTSLPPISSFGPDLTLGPVLPPIGSFGPDPTSGSYHATPLPQEAARTFFPPVTSSDNNPDYGSYRTVTTPPPASFNAQGYPGYGGGQGRAR
ncbi:hypothetical protein [Streptomyces sp. NPDC006012]|uniref:hypothetical protein n=1 Tax=Streptomyces sp. NPDC006012 TaxID=3364739 RepID=UPI0036765854